MGMDTRIRDVSTDLMAGAVGKLKDVKKSKADNAFYALFDTAVKNGGKDNLESLSSLGSNNCNDKNDLMSDKRQNSELSKVNSKPNDYKMQNNSSKKTGSKDAVQSATERDVVKEVCEELGVDENALKEKLDALMNSIKALLMKKFNISEEELNSVLENLGLSLVDMFQPTDLMNVLVEITGVQDIAAVLTDENLYAQVQDLMQELGELQGTFTDNEPISAEDLQQISDRLQLMKNADETVSLNQNGVATDATADTEDANMPVLEVVTDKNLTEKNDRQNGGQMTGQEGFQQFAGQVAQYAENAINVADNAVTQQADMQEIMRQIVDTVRLQVQEDTTSLEMQLHPESYGRLNLHISVKEGVVTAQLAVENEMVRHALEAQIVQLREEMDAKGLKVDAVEVTIASHEFERNLNEHQQEDSRSDEAGNSARRQINLREGEMSLEELVEMSEAEALTRKIMLENGNSVDFSA